MRIVVFTDVNGFTTGALLRALLRLARESDAYDVVGVVTTRPGDFQRTTLERVRRRLSRAVSALAAPEVPFAALFEREADLFSMARREGFPVVVPPGGDPNDPGFIRELQTGLRPDVGLSFVCRHRFRRPLRDVFSATVNYHDGLLPAYRGVMATAFSIFAAETESGLSFHRMTDEFDAGPVLVEDSVPIDENSTLIRVSSAKRRRVGALLSKALNALAAGDPGRRQSGPARYYSRSDWLVLTTLSEPENATRKEIERRIRAFGAVHIEIDGVSHTVARLRSARRGSSLAFRTLDGQRVEPARVPGSPFG